MLVSPSNSILHQKESPENVIQNMPINALQIKIVPTNVETIFFF